MQQERVWFPVWKLIFGLGTALCIFMLWALEARTQFAIFVFVFLIPPAWGLLAGICAKSLILKLAKVVLVFCIGTVLLPLWLTVSGVQGYLISYFVLSYLCIVFIVNTTSRFMVSNNDSETEEP